MRLVKKRDFRQWVKRGRINMLRLNKRTWSRRFDAVMGLNRRLP